MNSLSIHRTTRVPYTRVTAIFLLAAALILAGCRSASQYISRGNQLFDKGQYSDAVLNYRNAVKKSPQSGEAYYRLGLALLKQSHAVEAYQAFQHAVSLSPNNADAKIQFANLSLAIYARDPKHPPVLYNQAQAMATQLLGPGGNRAQGLRIKAALALLDHHTADAVDTMKQAVQAAPNSSEISGALAEAYLRDNQPEQAEKTAHQILDRDPKYAPAYEMLYAIYISQQKFDQGEAILKQWSANNPKDATPVLRLAGFYYARKQPEQGEQTVNSLLDHRDRFPQADLLVGDFHALVRNPEKALADFERGEARDHTRQEIYQERIARMQATLGKRSEAMKTADAILAKDPKNEFARTIKIQLLSQLGGPKNLDAALTMANDLAKDAPSNPRIQTLAGQVYLLKGNLDLASQHLQRAAQLDSRNPAGQLALARLELLRKNYQAVLDHADAALAIRANDPNARLFRVIGLTGTHEYGAAKTEAEQLARDTKDAPQVEMQLGVIALGQGHYSEAEQLFGKLYKEGSNNLQPLAGLVNTYEAEHQADKALALMRQETERTPDSKGKEALLIATAEAAGKSEVALSELQKLAAQNPSAPDLQLRIGQVQEKNGNLAAALQAYERARELAPTSKVLDGLIAETEERLGKKTEAIADYRKALSKSPDNPLILNNLAFLVADTGGDINEARQMIMKAIQKAPKRPQLQDTLAWIDMKQHNDGAALQILSALTNDHPEDATFRYHYALALYDTGNPSEAKEQAQTALLNKPEPDTAASLRKLIAQAK